MKKSMLITGGARSGKSELAERMALAASGRAVYIATAEAGDGEMAERIARHRARRGAQWTDVAAPLDLVGALAQSDGDQPRLVDCLTLWLSNMMLSGADWTVAGRALADAIPDQKAPVIFVTNEVGSGIVPENKLAREFRDAAGWLNQEIASVCDEVWISVSGIPLKVKPNEHSF